MKRKNKTNPKQKLLNKTNSKTTNSDIPNKSKLFKFRRKNKDKPKTKISSSFRLFKDSLIFFFEHWKITLGIALVYGLLIILLVGLGSIDDMGGNGLDGNGVEPSQVSEGVTAFSSLLGANTSPGGDSSSYQAILTIMVSLATVWAMRQIMSGKTIQIRDTFYKGMYPLVPVIIVILVIGLQLIPIAIAGFIYASVVLTGLAGTGIEIFIWFILVFLLILLSLYMVSSSIFAFYIAALPDIRPLKALRSARMLVKHKRWQIMRRVLFLPFSLLFLGMLIVLPLIWLWPPLAQWVFFALTMSSVVFSHVYLYSLYKELL